MKKFYTWYQKHITGAIFIGLILGIDWRLNNRWGICADLSWGLNGVFKKDFETIEQTMYPIYGSVGITYQLK